MSVTVVIAAGGKGTRMAALMNKIFLDFGSKTVIERTVEIFNNNPLITEIIVVTGLDDIDKCKTIIGKYEKVKAVVEGGAFRRESVYNGLKLATGDIVAVHDAARALVTDEIICEVIEAAREYGAAAPGVLCKDTLKKSDNDGFIEATIDRSSTYQIQTPQTFKTEILRRAHETVSDVEATDDCMLVEKTGVRIKITKGSYENIKLTTPEDMIIGENILKRRGAL